MSTRPVVADATTRQISETAFRILHGFKRLEVDYLVARGVLRESGAGGPLRAFTTESVEEAVRRYKPCPRKRRDGAPDGPTTPLRLIGPGINWRGAPRGSR